MGPLLFLVYINDLLSAAPALNYILYVDGTNIFCTDLSSLELKNETKFVGIVFDSNITFKSHINEM